MSAKPDYNISYGSAVRVSAIIRYRSAVEIAILSTKGQRGNLVNTASVRATRLFACVFLLGHVGFAQKIMVRVINGRDGHPLSKQTVVAQFLDEQPTKASSPQQITTDGNGEAEVSIPEPQPGHLNIRLALTPDHWHCSCWVMTDTENVVRDGIVRVAAMTKPNVQVTAKPGQVVFIAIPFTLFEEILRPLIKQSIVGWR